MNSVQYSDPVPMDPIHRPFFDHGFQALPPIRSQHQHLYPSPTHSSGTSFPILAIAILGITATAFLLVSYYVFVIKCCLNWHRIDLLRRFSIPQSRRNEDPLMAYSPAIENRGLDELEIRAIPLLHFNRGEREGEERSFYECAVCLNEFQEDEKLRVLPNCSHAFHIDCIDIWLQSNANCPLCRSSISTTTRFPIEQIFAPSSSPQDPQPFTGSFIGSEEDFVVIELGEEGDQSLPRQEERNAQVSVQSVSPLPRKLEQRLGHKRARKLHKVGSLGDECIDIRERDDQFLIQPIRRSISMNSSDDRQLYLAVQEIIQQNRHFSELSTGEGCSSRIRRSFFSFGHGRGSRNAVLPI